MTLLRGKQIVLPKSQIQQGVRDFKRNQLRGETAHQTSIPQAEVQPTEVAEPTQEPSMPTDEHSNVAYEEMSAEDAWDRLVTESGDDVDIATIVAQSNIEDAQKALDKTKKQTPKLVGTTEEKLAAAKAFKESVVKAQNDLTAWQEIADVPKRRASLQTETAEVPASEELAKVENETFYYNLSDEVDENGRQFLLNSNGDIVFGQIEAETGLQEAPILLSEGIITNPSTNAGYRLVHIEARHGDQIRAAGYKSVIEFIEEVAKKYEVIIEGNNRDGYQTYMLQLTDKHNNNTLMVELSGDGTYWNINTAGIFKTSYGKNRKEVYNRHTTVKQSTEIAEESQSDEQSGTQTPSRMNTPTQPSTDKGRTNSPISNELGEKNAVSSIQEQIQVAEVEVSFANDLVSRAWGENLRSKKQQQSFANRIRKQMRQHAQSLAETLRITQKHENVQKIALN